MSKESRLKKAGLGSLLFLALGTVQVQPALAQILPFRSSSALTIGFEERALRSFISTTQLAGLREDGESIPDPTGLEMRVTAVPFAMPYAVYRTVVPIFRVPVVHKGMSINTPSGRDTVTNSGLGDASILVKFAPLQWDRLNQTRRIAFFGGVKFPTGSTDRTDAEGELLPAALQIGTGAYEIPLGVSFTMQTAGRIGIVTDFFYNVNTTGEASTGRDSFKYDLALGWRAHPSDYRTFRERVLNFYLELNGTHEMDSGNLVFVSPGVQFIALQNMLFELSTQIPVYQNFNGIRPEIDYTIAGGFRWLFPW